MPRKIRRSHVGGGLIKRHSESCWLQYETVTGALSRRIRAGSSQLPATTTSLASACSYFGDTVPLTLARTGQIEWFHRCGGVAGELLPARSQRGIPAGGGVPNYLLAASGRWKQMWCIRQAGQSAGAPVVGDGQIAMPAAAGCGPAVAGASGRWSGGTVVSAASPGAISDKAAQITVTKEASHFKT